MSNGSPDAAPPVRFRHRVEYGALACAAAIARTLPYRLALAFAWCVAAFLFHVARFRRRETLRRIGLVFPGIPRRRARRIAWTSLRNLAFNAVEMLRIRSFDRATLERRIANLREGVETIRRVATRPDGSRTGIVLALPHMGNWDLAGSACHLCGEPIFSVAGRQRNPLANDLINRLRSGHGMDIIERGGRTLGQIVVRLRRGDVFAILPDSRSRHPDIEVPFLGGRANLARGMATFAHATGAPIIPLHMLREGWTRFRFVMGEPVYPDPSADKPSDVRRMTEIVVAHVDAAIHEHPEQWFWYNKRWVLDPVEPDPPHPPTPADAPRA